VRVTGINWGILLGAQGHIAQSQGDHLDLVHSGLKILEVIWWARLVLVIKAKRLKTSSRDHQARVTQIRWFS
jgi:hypothetical protein